ncbi:DUF1642 domain-containing protein [Enterococcus sp.]|uniref:DUF1642 domain-containing protein n=1 Tax=Enterococcus sp. TaxID=35783 RepID=UPI003C7508F6
MKKEDVIDRLKGKYERAIENRNLFGVNSRGWMANEVRAVSYQIAIDLIKKIEEVPKVEVPDYVAEWIEYAKKKGHTVIESAQPWNLYGAEYSKVNFWIKENQDTFARAFMDGYTIKSNSWVVRFESRYTYYFSGWCTENPLDPNGFRSKNDSHVIIFDKKAEAEKLAKFIDGTVVEV